MSTKIIHFMATQLSVGSALQNIVFYAMLIFLACLVIFQFKFKEKAAKRRSVAK